jgi:hypothetical protein
MPYFALSGLNVSRRSLTEKRFGRQSVGISQTSRSGANLEHRLYLNDVHQSALNFLVSVSLVSRDFWICYELAAEAEIARWLLYFNESKESPLLSVFWA